VSEKVKLKPTIMIWHMLIICKVTESEIEKNTVAIQKQMNCSL